MKQKKKRSPLVLIHHCGKLVNRFIQMEHMVFPRSGRERYCIFHETIFESKLYLSPSDGTRRFSPIWKSHGLKWLDHQRYTTLFKTIVNILNSIVMRLHFIRDPKFERSTVHLTGPVCTCGAFGLPLG